MPLTNHGDVVLHLQKCLGQAFRESPLLLNLPGRSLACKVDPSYYLAVEPAFTETLARLSVRLPARVREALVRTGNIVSLPPRREWLLKLGVAVSGGHGKIKGCFVVAEFIDRALILHGGRTTGLEVSDLRLERRYKTPLEKFFAGKTPLHDMAFEQA